MNYIIKVIIISVITFVSLNVSAQNFQGKATYKTKRKLDLKLDSTKLNSSLQQKVMEMLNKQFEKTFTLSFNKEESLYKEEEGLGTPQSSNVQMVVIGDEGSDILYRNLKEKRYTSQNSVMGKIFLIEDALPKLDWKLTKETKNIGQYTCFKATITSMVPAKKENKTFSSKHSHTNDNEKPQMEKKTIIAWYTPEIPISSGPADYYGLPGLILEVNDGSETIVCSKIVLNPKDKVTIVEPKNGKKVNKADFISITEKRMKEELGAYGLDGESGTTIEYEIISD